MANNQTIDITVGETDYTFNVTRDAYNRFINAATSKPVQAMTNFLTTTVTADQQAAFVELIKETPGAETQVFGAVIEEYTPDLGVVVKKRKK